MLREKSEVVDYEVTVDKKRSRVLVSVQMTAKLGRERTHRVDVNDVRGYLESQGVDVGVLVSGNAIHNNMDRRLGLRTPEDLRANWVFAIAGATVEEAPVVVEAVAEVASEVSAESVVEAVVEKPQAKRSRKPRAKKSIDK